jgi:membrane protein implicated in regulation of membrane protease activity
MDVWTIAFLVAGLVLIASEAVAPALVSVFLGVAAIITAGLRWLGIVEGLPVSLLLFAFTSLALAIPGRLLINRLVPGRSDVRRDRTDVDNDKDAMGEIVTVVEDVSDEHDTGRIRFQGTTWQARSVQGVIARGQQAQLVYREGSLWIVEPVVVDGGARDLFHGMESQEASEVAEAAAAARATRRDP